MKQETVGVKRNGSIECLRCVLMYSVVCCHVHAFGIWSQEKGFVDLLFRCLLYWHVPAFVAITGWFGIRFSWKKFLRLWGVCAFYSILSWTWDVYNAGHICKPMQMTAGWFGTSYFILMLCAPFINLALDKAVSLTNRQLLSIWGGLTVAFVLQWFPLHFVLGHDTAFLPLGFMTLLYIYITTRLLSQRDIVHKLNASKMIGGAVLFLIISAVLCSAVYYGHDRMLGRSLPIHADILYAFNSPTSWIMGIAIVCFVIDKCSCPNWLATVATFLGKSMFPVYLIHLCTSFGFSLYDPIGRWFSERGVHSISGIFLTSIVVFVVSLSIDLLRRLLLSLFLRLWRHLHG